MYYHVLNNSIVLNYLGKNVVVSKDDSRYEDVLACIRENRLDDIPAVVEIERAFEGTGLELRDGVLFEGEEAMPPELNARVMAYKEQNIPYQSLLLFWQNLRQNPSYNSRQQLFKFLEHNGHPLTEDGCFIAYRGVTEEFKDVHTGRFDNSVGSTCKMERRAVDDDPNKTCSSGLHVACHSYASGFGSQLIVVKVNPRDVVCVPIDYDGTKMRVCEFTVVSLGDKTKLVEGQLYGHNPADEEKAEESEESEETNPDDCANCGESDVSGYNYCPHCGDSV